MAKTKPKPGTKTPRSDASNQRRESHSNIGAAADVRFDKLQWLYLLALVVVGALIYANTLQSPFIFDDDLIIIDNPAIRMQKLRWSDIQHAVSGKGGNRPLSNLTFALNYYFGQYNPSGYHIVNMAVHIITGLLLYIFLKTTLKICRRQNWQTFPLDRLAIDTISGLTALLWLTSPVQTQSVTYIVQRTNSMAAMFFVLALLCYVKGRMAHRKVHRISVTQNADGNKGTARRHYYVWYAAGAIAAMLAWGSKENSAVLPFFIWLYEWYFFQDLSKQWLKKQLPIVAGILLLFGAIAFSHLGLEPWEKFKGLRDFSAGEFTVGQRLLTQTRVVVYYLSLIFFPHPSRLNLDYDFPISQTLVNPYTTLISLAIIIALIVTGVWLAKKQRLISFCIWWFIGNLLIESSIIPLAIIFEHRLYLPSMLVFLPPVILAYRYLKRLGLTVGVCGILAAVSALGTVERNKVWRDHLSMWTDCVRKSPHKARPYANLANAQKDLNLLDEALQNYRQSIRINPNLPEAHYNLGVLLGEQSSTSEAIDHYLKAVQLNPKFADAHNNLGSAFQKQGQPQKAEKHLRQALQLEPDHAEALNNLGFILAAQNEYDAAIVNYRKALQIDPDFVKAHKNLGFALQRQGDLDQAVVHYRKALELLPGDSETRIHLANALTALGKNDQAAGHIQAALQTKSDNAQALNNLGAQLLNQGKLNEALALLTRAVEIKPDLAEAHNNLGIILIRQGKLTPAISHFQEAVRVDPDFALAKNNLKRAVAIREGMQREIVEIQKELSARADDPGLLFKLGNLYLGLGEWDKAIIELEKALALQPTFKAAQNNLAMAYTADRRYGQALTAFEKLIELDPAQAGNYYNMAVLYALQNKVPQAIVWLKKAIDRGYRNWDLIKTDPDLANIRNSAEYQQLMEGR